MPLDREQARHVLLEALPADPKWGVWVDGILDRLEPARPVSAPEYPVESWEQAAARYCERALAAEAKLARIRALCDEPSAAWVSVRAILDAP